MEEKILQELEEIKKELQDIRSILEPKKFIPETSDGPCKDKLNGVKIVNPLFFY